MKIKDLAKVDRPREKLIAKGVDNLQKDADKYRAEVMKKIEEKFSKK